jgi:menaquinone-dependent protoporphyrinogen oxidase
MSAPTVLVAYASKRGSTREVAEAVAATLRDHGLHVVIRPAAEVAAVAEYEAVVLGAALYMGRLHGDARKLLKRQRIALRGRFFAVFAMGPRTLSGEDVSGARKQLEKGLDRASIVPDATAVFGGVFDPAKLPFPLNRVPASDARDWATIRAWAVRVAEEIGRTAAAA